MHKLHSYYMLHKLMCVMCIIICTYTLSLSFPHFGPSLPLHLPESTAPVNFTVRDITNTSASFLWSPPLDANGIISAYIIIVSDGADDIEMIIANPIEVTFSDLKPFVNYTATIFATNSFGNGTSTQLAFITITGSKCYV